MVSRYTFHAAAARKADVSQGLVSNAGQPIGSNMTRNDGDEQIARYELTALQELTSKMNRIEHQQRVPRKLYGEKGASR